MFILPKAIQGRNPYLKVQWSQQIISIIIIDESRIVYYDIGYYYLKVQWSQQIISIIIIDESRIVYYDVGYYYIGFIRVILM